MLVAVAAAHPLELLALAGQAAAVLAQPREMVLLGLQIVAVVVVGLVFLLAMEVQAALA
jgi:hypothetical protein